jgi:hypothetical protein
MIALEPTLALLLLALALLLAVLAYGHRQDEKAEGFAAGFAARFGAPRWLAAAGPDLAFLVVLGAVVAGFWWPVFFALAAGFALADKAIVHDAFQIPGDSGYWASGVGLALVALQAFTIGEGAVWAFFAGTGLLVGYVVLSVVAGRVAR